jgi:hypothetical protein
MLHHHIITSVRRSHTVSKNKNGVTLISYIVYREDRANLHILIDVEQTVLRKSTLFALSGNIEKTDETDKGVKFLLCSSCFWCASCLSPDSTFTECRSCSRGNIESIPIAENENYRFNSDIKRGITIEFR